MEAVKLVAVYGSLRKGLHNHGVLGGSKCIGEGVVKGFGMYSLGAYPALTSVTDEKTDVVVELYDVSTGTFDDLDHLEGYPSYYNRKLCRIHRPQGDVIAWVYFINGPLEDNEFVAGGDWKKYLGEV